MIAAGKGRYGIDIRDARRDESRQKSQVEDFIRNRTAAIVLTPRDSNSEEVAMAIADANRKHIPVFMADITLNQPHPGYVISQIASDNRQGGREAAQLMCTALGKRGEVAILDETSPAVTSVVDRVKGFRDEIQRLCPRIAVVIDIDGSGQFEKARAAMEDALQSNPGLNGVFAINDDSARGAVDAIRTFGTANAGQRKSKIAIVGYDASREARDAIKRGEIYGDVAQYPSDIGLRTMRAVHAFLSGKKVWPIIRVRVGSVPKRP
jgi:ribose transport system substrate-binding protein